jgi:CheY-like chemotaxis protein
MLTDNGFIVFEMDSPIKALEYFIKNRGSIDFILTDIIMPGMDGIALSKKIREIDIRIPILFMTGYSDDFLPQEDMERYKDTILQKPFSESQLINKIKEMLV